MRSILVISFLCLTAVGCEESSPFVVPPVIKATDVPSAPSHYDGPITTLLDSEALQDGIGPIDEDAPQEFTTTDSGLKYRILRASSEQKPTAESKVTVHYRGWLSTGKEFDGSYSGDPTSFGLTGVIAGWTEGLQLVGLGGMIELWIPSELGYGTTGYDSLIPGNSTLHFVIELLEVE